MNLDAQRDGLPVIEGKETQEGARTSPETRIKDQLSNVHRSLAENGIESAYANLHQASLLDPEQHALMEYNFSNHFEKVVQTYHSRKKQPRRRNQKAATGTHTGSQSVKKLLGSDRVQKAYLLQQPYINKTGIQSKIASNAAHSPSNVNMSDHDDEKRGINTAKHQKKTATSAARAALLNIIRDSEKGSCSSLTSKMQTSKR